MKKLDLLDVDILKCLLLSDKRRCEIIEILKVKRTTLYDRLVILERHRIVSRYSDNNYKRGRPITLWKVNKDILKYTKFNLKNTIINSKFVNTVRIYNKDGSYITKKIIGIA